MLDKLIVTFLIPPLLLALLIINRLYLWHIDARKSLRLGCSPPTSIAPIREPLLGLDFLIRTLRAAKEGQYLPFITSQYNAYGPTFVTRRVFYDTVHTIDPQNLKHMLATDFHSFQLSAQRLRGMRPLFGHGIFTTDGERWAHSRALLRPCFTRNNMKPLLNMLEEHFQALVKCVVHQNSHSEASQMVEFDAQPLFFNLAMDAATDFLLGHSTHTLDPTMSGEAEAAFVRDYLVCCVEAVKKIQMGPLAVVSVNVKAMMARRRAWRYLDRFVDEAIDLRRSGKLEIKADGEDEGRYNFLRELARETGDRVVLRDQILAVLLASKDTTAGLLSNLFFMLARHPELYEKLRQEVEDSFRGKLPTEEGMKNMVYLRWCINESLRLHPPIPANTREAAVDTTFPVGGGPDGTQPVFLRKGTCVVYYVYAMHRRKDIYGPDADEFRPERWDGLRPGWAFLPFNGGPRICLGQQFALTEASYIIVRMIQTFSAMVTTDDQPWVEFHHLAVCSKNGVKVKARMA